MSTKERAIAAIDSLPEGSDMADILREIAFIMGTDEARQEIARGEGVDATEAKADRLLGNSPRSIPGPDRP